MNEKKNKEINHNFRAKLYKTLGALTIAFTTIGGFVLYESFVDWNNFQHEVQNFVVIQEETAKLNMTIALPSLIGAAIFVFVMMRKNKSFFEDKVSLSLLILTGVFYLVYSVIEVTLFSLAGATVGAFIDEFGFSLLSKKHEKEALEKEEDEREERREKRRIAARRKAAEELDGSV